ANRDRACCDVDVYPTAFFMALSRIGRHRIIPGLFRMPIERPDRLEVRVPSVHSWSNYHFHPAYFGPVRHERVENENGPSPPPIPRKFPPPRALRPQPSNRGQAEGASGVRVGALPTPRVDSIREECHTQRRFPMLSAFRF